MEGTKAPEVPEEQSNRPAPGTRGTLSFTHRQVGTTGLAALLVMAMPYLKDVFFSKEEGKIIATQIEYMRIDIASLKEEQKSSTKQILDEVKASEGRNAKNDDRIERRVDTLEQAVILKPSRTRNN